MYVLANQGKHPLTKFPVIHWPIIACLLSNDCIGRMPQIGPSTIIAIGEILNAKNAWTVESVVDVATNPNRHKDNCTAKRQKLKSKCNIPVNH